ncbi:MAG: LptF/LptG family permease [Candidatus Krumholzibacteria bacterium]|nr:LptF/LptG family permease [Candidatus Krumholzibacteria bacterium]MDH4336497.1 LptF/LptG family permease [Candidatus Krumholzibacteria bacterium]MDH5269578.1 LptF/LptG family permease [Candidatus Krumholzibacteria bacterium]
MIFERYILRNYLGPFFFSMAVITFVFIMDFILRYIDLFLGKGVKFHIVLQVFALSLGHMFALIIPMAVLPATLMTYGNLSGENEITAMRACGVSLYRMIVPGLIGAALMSAGLVVYNNHVLPESNHRLLNLLIDIQRKQPTVELRANRFIDDLQGYTIYFAEKNDRTGDISEVQIFKKAEKDALPTTIIAESGHLQFIEGQNLLRVDLKNGEIHELPLAKDRETYRRTSFKEYTINIRDVDRSLQRSERDYRGDREMSVRMMEDKIQEIRSEMELARQEMIREAGTRMDATFSLLDARDRARMWAPRDSAQAARQARAGGAESGLKPRMRVRPSDSGGRVVPLEARNEFLTRQRIETEINKRGSFAQQIRRYQVEIHKKYSIPFACVIFVLVGAPLALRMGRSGMNMAIGLSILFFLIYYVGLIGGEKLADRGITSPFVAMWAPNIIFGIMAVLLLRKAAREQAVSEWSAVSLLRTIFRRNATANS